jgi:GNAT superfamily N-acetyltransferase
MFSIADITEANLADIPESCRACVYWEFPEDFDKAKEQKTRLERRSEFVRKKHEWFVNTMKEFGTCGKIAYSKDRPVAYAQFAPSERIPNIAHYKSHPVGKSEEGVVFLSCLYVADEESRGKGLGKMLLRNIIDDVRKRGFKAVETFARRGNLDNPSGSLEFYIRNGFTIKDQTNPEFPLVRISLRPVFNKVTSV